MVRYFSHRLVQKTSIKNIALLLRRFLLLISRSKSWPCTALLLSSLLLTLPATSLSTSKTTVGFLVGISGLGDQSFNDMAYAGLFRVNTEFDTHLIFEDSEKSDEAFEKAMQRLIQKGSNIIVANGFYMKELVEKYAKQHPGIDFILQDAFIENLDNVVCILYSVNEGSFLAGAFAALMSKSQKVGFIGGVDTPIMHSFRKGFKQGAKYISEEISVQEQFISTAPDFSGFKNPAQAHEIAVEFYNSGIDIIFSAAGLSGNGAIQAAKQQGKFVIGVDSDQDYMAKGHVLTSMMKRLDIATYIEVKKLIEGNSIPGAIIYGLAEDGVGLSPMKFTSHLVPDEVMEEIKKIKHDIIAGKLSISGH